MDKYRRIYLTLRRQIEQNQLRPGDRLPSIRSYSGLAKVSKNTIIRAYMALEDDGLIEARERSGFVVCSPALAVVTDELPTPHDITQESTAISVIRAASRSGDIAFGSAHPEVQFPACRQFFRSLARQSYRAVNDDKVGGHYADPHGQRSLRQMLAQRMSLQGSHLEAGDVLVTNGAMEAISLALKSVADKGDIIAVEKPAYYANLSCIEAHGMKVLEIPSRQDAGIDLDLLRKALRQWPVKGVLVNPSFNNPAGFSMPLEKRLELLEISAEFDVPIIEDDVFGELYYGKTREPTLKHLDDDGRVIYCNSLSKTLHPDIRIGWAVPGRYFEKMAHMKYVSSLTTSGVLQRAAVDFLNGTLYERHLRRVRRHYGAARDQISQAIYQHWPTPVVLSRPQGGFLLWCVLPESVDGDTIYARAKERGINISPGSLFSCDREFRHCLRLNFATWRNDPPRIDAIKVLGGLIEDALNG